MVNIKDKYMKSTGGLKAKTTNTYLYGEQLSFLRKKSNFTRNETISSLDGLEEDKTSEATQKNPE